jgi:hypothetical protein
MVMGESAPALLVFLGRYGIGLKELVDCGLELFVPHPGCERVNVDGYGFSGPGGC